MVALLVGALWFLLQSSSRWGLQVLTVELERTQYYYYLVPLLRARNTTTGEAGCDDRDLNCNFASPLGGILGPKAARRRRSPAISEPPATAAPRSRST
jgi:hypothetical protein